MTTKTTIRTVRCNCGAWLGKLTIIPDQRPRHRLRRCDDCHKARRPSRVDIFVDESSR